MRSANVTSVLCCPHPPRAKTSYNFTELMEELSRLYNKLNLIFSLFFRNQVLVTFLCYLLAMNHQEAEVSGWFNPMFFL